MDITLNGLLCIRIILGWLYMGSPPPFPWAYEILRGIDGIHKMHSEECTPDSSQVPTGPPASIGVCVYRLESVESTEYILRVG